MYPSPANPGYGIFVHNHVERIETRYPVEFRLVVSTMTPKNLIERVTKYLDLPVRSSLASLSSVDLVHFHYPSPAHIPSVLPPLFARRGPLVVTLHGGDISMPPPSGAKRLMVSSVLRCADAVIAVSDEVKRMCESLGVPPDLIEVISMGCDLDLFRFFPPSEKAGPKRALGIDARTPLVLFAGDLVPRKGCDLLFDAIAGDHAFGELMIGVAGDGPEKPLLEARIRGSSIEHRVRWLGSLPQRELARWYAGADAFVFPTRQEPLGLVTLEAMASGTPVLAARTGGVPELVEDDVNGLLFEVNDVRGLAVKLRTLLADRALRQRLACAAAITARAHALDRQVERVMGVYRRVLNGV
jgi:glycosyltransferase involved in cell wall biosynthesis